MENKPHLPPKAPTPPLRHKENQPRKQQSTTPHRPSSIRKSLPLQHETTILIHNYDEIPLGKPNPFCESTAFHFDTDDLLHPFGVSDEHSDVCSPAMGNLHLRNGCFTSHWDDQRLRRGVSGMPNPAFEQRL